jgi:hypothetical protein
MFGRRKLASEARDLLGELAAGAALKVHRDVDGGKVYRLHPLTGAAREVDERLVADLRRRGLIESNMKFPAATYLLTEKGGREADRLVQRRGRPISSRSYFE